jgi:hypothetical protein
MNDSNGVQDTLTPLVLVRIQVPSQTFLIAFDVLRGFTALA